jgi:uncharacterized protein YbjT (DUF2867 family)
MNILILGANGFIGSVVAARLLKDGHVVTGLARNAQRASIKQPCLRWIAADLSIMTSSEAWQMALAGQHIVVNCAGALQDGLADNLAATQEKSMLALYAAGKNADVKLIVQISARTGGAASRTAFLATKRNADQALAGCSLPYVILRPALVLGRNAHGGTALLRALAAFPLFTPLAYPGNSVETVSVYDVASAVSSAIAGELPWNADIDLATEERQSLAELVKLHRRWLGLAPARVVAMPAIIARPVSWLADISGYLGWRSPLRSTAMAVMSEGVLRSADSSTDPRLTLTSAADMLAANPSAVQDLWFARLYLLKPLMIATLSLFWLLSGLIPLADISTPSRHFLPFLSQAAATGLLIATCLLDIALGLAVLIRPCARSALIGMIAVSLSYLAGGTLLEPALWRDPLGPLVKVLPSILLTLATLATLEER